MKRKLRRLGLAILSVCLGLGLLTGYTFLFSVKQLPPSLAKIQNGPVYANILDRNGYLLSFSRENELNYTPLPLWKIPDKLVQAFILAEDKRFYSHWGVDWLARFNALIDNIRAGGVVRGASTITEQCVRILHPRKRTIYSRWVETIEAYQLERKFSKAEILEFYLNQVPFSRQCRGISQAADFYYGRTLDTLNLQEMLSLAVMVRAPSSLDPYKKTEGLNKRVTDLGCRMKAISLLSDEDLKGIGIPETGRESGQAEAPHFIQFLKREYPDILRSQPQVITSIDSNLQDQLSRLLKESLKNFKHQKVAHGCILVLNHQTDEVLAWVNSQDFFSDKETGQIDAVLTPRQPGSALKPFLYALALTEGYTPASIIPDIPIVQPVGNGLHTFKNYSNTHYGPLRLRCALGNSLNIPAVRTVQHIGVGKFLDTLHRLGMHSLKKEADYYGEGLALGNGEVSLFELVRAYSVLARGGIYREPKFFLSAADNRSGEKRIFTPEICSLIAHILSDPSARMLEFGRTGLLDFPVQTAVKTGTSTDYRDAWAVGFNYKYTVGVWMGNLDYTPMLEITGSRGPAFILRAAFNQLNKHEETQPLFFSRTLKPEKICALSGKLASPACSQTLTEWFLKDNVVPEYCDWHKKQGDLVLTAMPHAYQEWLQHDPSHEDQAVLESQEPQPQEESSLSLVKFIQPVPGLHMAIDPRIPDGLQKFPFKVESDYPIEKINWFLDNNLLAATGQDVNSYLWTPRRGSHLVYAEVKLKDIDSAYSTSKISFLVK